MPVTYHILDRASTLDWGGNVLVFGLTAEQAVHMVHSQNTTTLEEWSFTTEEPTVNQAVEIMNHFISQKFALMPDNKISNTDVGQLSHTYCMRTPNMLSCYHIELSKLC